jgi:hypothetical protein
MCTLRPGFKQVNHAHAISRHCLQLEPRTKGFAGHGQSRTQHKHDRMQDCCRQSLVHVVQVANCVLMFVSRLEQCAL